MELKELEKLRDYNELDLLYKIIEIAEKNKRRTEEFLKGNKASDVNITAGVDIRWSMQDIRLLAMLIRESVQSSKGAKKIVTGNYKGEIIPLTTLEKAIVDEKLSIKNDENKSKRAENLRTKKRKEKVQ